MNVRLSHGISTPKASPIRTVLKEQITSINPLRILVMVLFTTGNVLGLLQPFLLGRLIDGLSSPTPALVALGSILIGLVCLEFGFDWLQNYMWFKMIHRGISLARSKVLSLLLNRRVNEQGSIPNGDLVNRIIHDTGQYAEQMLIRWPMLILNVSSLLIIFAFLFYLNIWMAVCILGLSMAYFLAYRRLNILLRLHMKEERARFSEIMQSTQQFISGKEIIQLYHAQPYFSKKYSSIINQHFQTLLRLQKWKSLGQSTTTFILNIMPVLSVLLGVYFMAKGQITIGTIFSFYSYLPYLSEPIRNLTDFNLIVQQAKSVEERLNQVMGDSAPAAPEIRPASPLTKVQFDHVSFRYISNDGGMKEVIKDLSFTLQKGQRLAITGTSGNGKSTCLRLLLNQLTPAEGEIRFNTELAESLKQEQLQGQLVVMPQDIFLFDGTCEENIHFGRDYTSAELNNAMNDAEVTLSGEQSITGVSGGERQRIGLARCLLKPAGLLVLDEPTSELDMETEQNIVRHLDHYLREHESMLIVVTHRPAILTICDWELRLLSDGKWELNALRQAGSLSCSMS